MEYWDLSPSFSGTGYLHRLDGRVKTVVLLFAVVVVSVLTRWFLVAGIMLATLALLCSLRLPLRKLFLRLLVPFGVAWLVLISLLFSTGNTVVETVTFWHLSLPVYREGAQLGLVIMLRILTAVSLAMLLALSTPMAEILATLRLLKVPGLIVDLADMIHRYAFSLAEMAATMRKAQRVRGGEGLPWYRQARDLGMVAGNLLIKSFDRSVRIYKAMLARGYDEDTGAPAYYTHHIPAKDLLAGVPAVLALVAVLITNFVMTWRGWP